MNINSNNKNKVNLIKFDKFKKINRFYNIKYNEEEDVIIVNFGRIGTRGNTRKYNASLAKFGQTIEIKIASGYKVLEMLDIEDTKLNKLINDNAILTNNCLIEYDDVNSQQFIRSIIESDMHNVEIINWSNLNSVKLYSSTMRYIKSEALIKAIKTLEEIEQLLPIYNKAKEEYYCLVKQIKQDQNNNKVSKLITNDLKQLYQNFKSIKSKLIKLNTNYFSLIPTKLLNFKIQNLISNFNSLIEYKNQCNLMVESLNYIENLNYLNEVKIFKVNDVERKEIEDLFHNSGRIYANYISSSNNLKINRLFKIKFTKNDNINDFNNCKVEIIKQLWYCTNLEDLLLIFTNGLLSSEKRSNYSNIKVNHDNGVRLYEDASNAIENCLKLESNNIEFNNNSTIYLLLVSVSMGNYFIPTGECYYNVNLNSYDTIWWQPQISLISKGVVIVLNSRYGNSGGEGSRIKLEYLVEIKKVLN